MNLNPPTLWPNTGFWLSLNNPILLPAQYQAFRKQIPVMYFILMINTWVLATTHFHAISNKWITIYFPGIMSVACLMRSINWLRMHHQPPETSQLYVLIKVTTLRCCLFAPAFILWAMLFFHAGTVETQTQVVFFVSVTIIGILFCVNQVWQVALILLVTVNLVFIIFLLTTQNSVFITIAINMALITVVLTITLLLRYRAFANLVYTRHRAEQLAAENLALISQDSLTRLPNRYDFFQILHTTCDQARENHQRFAVAILDLDGFKPVNDLHGHAMGDQLLIRVGQRLQHVIGHRARLTRLGGDEFALIMEHMPNDEAYTALASEICHAFHAPFVIDHISLQLSASIGLVVYPDLADNATDLYECADYALYQAKQHNKGSVSLFSRQHHERLRRNALIEQTLRRANLEHELSIWFQPIVHATTGRTVGFEALTRWHSPDIGPVSPGEFIPIAERCGQITRITKAALHKALTHAARWPAGMYLSFNLSVHDLMSADTVDHLLSILESSGLDPSRIDLEVTETAATHDMDQMKKTIHRLREHGFGIALDDLGSGFSSLGQLLSLPLTKIKIDRRFSCGIDTNATSRKVVASVLSLSRDMALDCVIEGVETNTELATLTALGGTLIQGYVFSKPMPADQVDAWLAAQNAD